MRRRRARTVVRWVCTLAALVVLSAAAASLFRTDTYVSVSKDGKNAWALRLAGGRLEFWNLVGYDRMDLPLTPGWDVSGRVPWSWGMVGNNRPIKGWRGGFLWYWMDDSIASRVAGVTLLYPFLLTAVPAAFLWYADRRRPDPGQCAPCHYDRRGLAPAAACPECGTVPAA